MKKLLLSTALLSGVAFSPLASAQQLTASLFNNSGTYNDNGYGAYAGTVSGVAVTYTLGDQYELFASTGSGSVDFGVDADLSLTQIGAGYVRELNDGETVDLSLHTRIYYETGSVSVGTYSGSLSGLGVTSMLMLESSLSETTNLIGGIGYKASGGTNSDNFGDTYGYGLSGVELSFGASFAL